MTDPNGSANGGQPGGEGAAGGGAADAAPWYGADAGDDIKGFVELKGWDSPVKAIASYRDLEKFLGADKAGRGFVWPKDETDTEGWKALHAKLGVPETPDAYKFELPEGDDGSFAKAAAPILHQLGITAKQAEGLSKFMAEHNKTASAAFEQQIADQVKAESEALKTEWGGAYEQNVELGKRAAIALGLDEGTINALEGAMGYKAVMQFMAKVGGKIGEDNFVSDGGPNPGKGDLSPEAAKVRFEQLKGDQAWMAKLLSGDLQAREEKDRLDANMLGMSLAQYRAAMAGRAA